MVEPWVYGINLGDDEEFDDGHDREVDPEIQSEFKDPDQPVQPSDSKRSTKQNRVGRAIVGCYQSDICRRKWDAAYQNDSSADGTVIYSIHFTLTNRFCSFDLYYNLVLR